MGRYPEPLYNVVIIDCMPAGPVRPKKERDCEVYTIFKKRNDSLMSNRIGKRGESIFSTIITRKSSSGKFLFDPTFLGDKFPVVDFYVALLDFPLHAFFFASVKTTTLGYTAKEGKLKISIDKEEIAELAKSNLPTYIFGVDELIEEGFFIAAADLDTALNFNGMPTIYPVIPGNLELLFKEVAEYWQNSHKNTKFVSSFK